VGDVVANRSEIFDFIDSGVDRARQSCTARQRGETPSPGIVNGWNDEPDEKGKSYLVPGYCNGNVAYFDEIPLAFVNSSARLVGKGCFHCKNNSCAQLIGCNGRRAVLN
jgi:hypothetical protein